MARGPVVAVTISADNQASRTFDKVGDDAKHMGDRVGGAGRDIDHTFERIDDSAGRTERGLRGLRDGFTGATDVMGTFGVGMDGAVGSTVNMIGGLTDLAGFVGDFATQVIPKLLTGLGLTTAATEGETVAQEGLNVAMTANPIGLVVAALAALALAFYVAWTKSETFREIVTGAFDAVTGAATATFDWIKDHWPLLLGIITGPIGLAVVEVIQHWDDIKAKVSEVKDWIAQKVSDIVTTITGLPGQISNVATDFFNKGKEFGQKLIDGAKQGISGLGSAILGAGGSALDFAAQIGNAVKDFVNSQIIDRINRALEIKVSGGRWLPDISINPPDIPHLAGGGIVRAVPGGVLALLGEAGRDEAVIPLPRNGIGGDTFIFYPQGYDARGVAQAQRRYNRRNGLG